MKLDALNFAHALLGPVEGECWPLSVAWLAYAGGNTTSGGPAVFVESTDGGMVPAFDSVQDPSPTVFDTDVFSALPLKERKSHVPVSR